MDKWIYRDEEVHNMPDGINAFVYKIEIGGYFYIGKKNVYSKRKIRLGKKALAEDKRKKYRHVVKETWQNYFSSSEEVKQLIKEGETPVRYIIRLCRSTKEATYYEDKLLHNAITEDNCLNKNIGGKYFKEEILRWFSDKV